MDTFETLTCAVAGPVATVTLNRPDARNAMSARMVDDLLHCFTTLADEDHADVRAVVLRAAGSAFCAGGDVRDLAMTTEEQTATFGQLDALLRLVNEAPQVVIARVQGAAMGGGFGLVCVCDLAIASADASFGLPEVRLGIAPAVISHYVVARIGLTHARRLMLTGALIGASEAHRIGIVTETCPVEALDDRVSAALEDVLRCAPHALRECKRLLFMVAGVSAADSREYRVNLLNRLRTGDEAREGARAFLTKQPAPWVVRP